MKTALVTGAAGGIGSAAVKALIDDGYDVWGLDLKKPERLPGLRFLETDLTDEKSVTNAFETLRAHGVTLDCIVHAAGLYDLDSLVEIGEARLANIFEVNFFAVCRVNRLFLPLIRKGGRILITTSELAPLDPLPFTGIYAVTKTALDRYAYSLRMELQLLGISVIVLRPGAVDTGLLDVSTRALDRFCAHTELYPVNAGRFREIVGKVEARKIPPSKAAKKIVKALDSKHPRLVYKINRNPLLLLLNALPDRLQCAIIRRILKTPEKRAGEK